MSYLSTSKASPNDTGIVIIIVIIIIGEVEIGLHSGGIIAQRFDSFPSKQNQLPVKHELSLVV
ncbi:MAG: hypothetical protein HZB50_05160 [Chloroflexi bacterium]|nr:hypothetical protein [Chloroflexota bacterium]